MLFLGTFGDFSATSVLQPQMSRKSTKASRVEVMEAERRSEDRLAVRDALEMCAVTEVGVPTLRPPRCDDCRLCQSRLTDGVMPALVQDVSTIVSLTKHSSADVRCAARLFACEGVLPHPLPPCPSRSQSLHPYSPLSLPPSTRSLCRYRHSVV